MNKKNLLSQWNNNNEKNVWKNVVYYNRKVRFVSFWISLNAYNSFFYEFDLSWEIYLNVLTLTVNRSYFMHDVNWFILLKIQRNSRKQNQFFRLFQWLVVNIKWIILIQMNSSDDLKFKALIRSRCVFFLLYFVMQSLVTSIIFIIKCFFSVIFRAQFFDLFREHNSSIQYSSFIVWYALAYKSRNIN